MKEKQKNKFKVVFETTNETFDEVVANALMTQLMVQITQIGLRVAKTPNTDVIIGKENANGKIQK